MDIQEDLNKSLDFSQLIFNSNQDIQSDLDEEKSLLYSDQRNNTYYDYGQRENLEDIYLPEYSFQNSQTTFDQSILIDKKQRLNYNKQNFSLEYICSDKYCYDFEQSKKQDQKFLDNPQNNLLVVNNDLTQTQKQIFNIKSKEITLTKLEQIYNIKKNNKYFIKKSEKTTEEKQILELFNQTIKCHQEQENTYSDNFIQQLINEFRQCKVKDKIKLIPNNNAQSYFIKLLDQLLPHFYMTKSKDFQYQESQLEKLKKIIQNTFVKFYSVYQLSKKQQQIMKQNNTVIAYEDQIIVYKNKQKKEIKCIKKIIQYIKSTKIIFIKDAKFDICEKDQNQKKKVKINNFWIDINKKTKLKIFDEQLFQLQQLWLQIKSEFNANKNIDNNLKIASFILFGQQMQFNKGNSTKRTNAAQDIVQNIKANSNTFLGAIFKRAHETYVQNSKIDEKNRYVKRYSIKLLLTSLQQSCNELNQIYSRDFQSQSKNQFNEKKLNILMELLDKYYDDICVEITQKLQNQKLSYLDLSVILDCFLKLYQTNSLIQTIKKKPKCKKQKKICKKQNKIIQLQFVVQFIIFQTKEIIFNIIF